MSGIMQKIEAACEKKNFYEAQQMYRSLVNRYQQQESWEKGIMVALGGIKKMISFSQYALANDLALLIVELFGKMKATTSTIIQVTDTQKFTVIELVEHILTFLPLDKALDQRITFLKAAVRFSQGKGEIGYPTLHLELARAYREQKEYKEANMQYSKSNVANEHAEMVHEWAQKGFTSEYDLFITRSVLQYVSSQSTNIPRVLCLKNVNHARALYDHYLTLTSETQDGTPLLNFVKFLFVALDKKSPPLYQFITQKYNPALKRDGEFDGLVKNIGELYFGVKQDTGFAGLFNSFASMLGGGNR